MRRRYPFKFLDAYRKTDTDIFFGREEEIDALYSMTFESDILLVYGASGTGKTSLINAGLAGRFEAHDWLALTIRRGNDLNDALLQKLEDAAATPAEDENLDLSWLDDTDESSPASILTQRLQALYRKYFRPIYLIFDQFEELYILGDADEQGRFIDQVREIQTVEQPVKMIFVIREEYLGHLFDFERAVPQLLRKKLRVEAMNLTKVGQVLHGAAQLEYSNIRLAAGEELEIINQIFQKVKGDQPTAPIQLPYLQVFLDKLYLHLTGDDERQADALFTLRAIEDMGAIGDVLREFLEEQAIRIQSLLSRRHSDIPEDTVWQILSPLATLEGTKEPLLETILLQRLAHLPESLVKEGLRELDQSRIIRFDENENRYELAHDSLAKPIASRRSEEEIARLEIRRLISSQMALKAEARELFSEKQLNLIEPFLDSLALDEEALDLMAKSRAAVAAQKEQALQRAELEKQRLLERQTLLEKNQRSQRRFIRLMGMALVGLIGLAVYAYLEAGRANRNAEIANANEQEAVANQKEAEALLAEVKKQQLLSAANELEAFGDAYLDIGRCEYARASYQTALDTLRAYPDLALYRTIQEKYDRPCR